MKKDYLFWIYPLIYLCLALVAIKSYQPGGEPDAVSGADVLINRSFTNISISPMLNSEVRAEKENIGPLTSINSFTETYRSDSGFYNWYDWNIDDPSKQDIDFEKFDSEFNMLQIFNWP